MQIEILDSKHPLPIERGYVLSMVIRSFKGRRDVEVHLYRSAWPEDEMASYDWATILGGTIERKNSGPADPDGSKKLLMEAFTREERDMIISYLSEKYASRLSKITAAPLGFPIPQGLNPLSSFPEGKTIGTIKLDKIPTYPLPFHVRGLYDLSQHRPIVEEKIDDK
ncbi:MAG: hypothetical protein PHO79_05365 [Desulfoplanes sp.]|nr:hypothetical protein [Desulfoplanes sp.]